MQAAQILTFRKPAPSLVHAMPSRGPAQIIIFPGVQYVRLEGEHAFSAATAPQRPSKWKRS